MTLPLQTWRVSIDYSFTAAGANPTPAEMIAALNTMLVAEVANGSYWGVSAYTGSTVATTNTLEIKRLGSPGGVLGAVRALIFGGTTAPNSAALGAGVAASANTMYAGIAEAAGISQAGPDAAYTAAAPYTTTTSKKWSGAGQFGTNASLTAAGGMRTFMIESDRCCYLFVCDPTRTHMVAFGGIAERLSDNAEIFACITSGSSGISSLLYSNLAASTSWFVPGNDSASISTTPQCGWHDGTNQNSLVRMMVTGRSSDSLLGVGRGTLVPIAMSTRVQTGISDSSVEFGILRQLRYGPYCNNKISVADSTPAITCYGVSAGKLQLSAGVYFDVNQ